MSYLNTPRLTFAGKFQADPSTVNNDINHFNNETFQPNYQEYGDGLSNGWWNPNGTGNWRLVGCEVKSVTYQDGTSTESKDDDPIIGMSIMDANARVAGKIVDLDPQQQSVSEIWGMVVRLWDGTENLLKSDFEHVAFNNIWWVRSYTLQQDAGASATYQSVLKNIEWSDKIKCSRYLRELRSASPDQLSIKFNVDIYQGNNTAPDFTLGRLVGSIGPYNDMEPEHFVRGRQLMPALNFISAIPGYLPFPKVPQPDSGNPPGDIYFATAVLLEKEKNIVIDLGNSLRTTGNDGTIEENRELLLAIANGDGTFNILSKINYALPRWYETSGGLVTITLTADQVLAACTTPLALVTPDGQGGYNALLTEQPYYVRADSFVSRLDPGDSATFELYATSYGKPLINQVINYRQQNSLLNIMGQSIPTSVPPPPSTGTPAGALTLHTSSKTDNYGITRLSVVAGDPGNPRGFIDGQIYAISATIDGQPTVNFDFPPQSLKGVNPNDFISILLHNKLDPETIESANWEDVQKVLQQYANLYPIMSKGIFNIADQAQVDKNAVLLKFAFSLPIEDPNYMPATRDLSGDKKQMILNYLDRVIAKSN